MGTNFRYEIGHPRSEEEASLELGLIAAGWRFLLRGHPDKGLTSWEQWKAFMADRPGKIGNEYGEEYSLAEFEALLSERQLQARSPVMGWNGAEGGYRPGRRRWLDDAGYAFSDHNFS